MTIYDKNKNFIPIYFKVNYIEFKQANKSFKSIHNFLSNDIHDRFLNNFVLLFIIINGLTEGKFKLNYNNNIYFKRIFFCFIAEILSDYLKAIILFKINNINPKNIKMFLKEEIHFYKELKNEKKSDNKYKFLNADKIYEYYSNIIDPENILAEILNVNIFPFYIILFHYFVFKIEISFYFKVTYILLLYGFKILNEKIIDYFILNGLNGNNKRISKSEALKINSTKIKSE